MDFKYIIVLVGFICVFEAEAATSELVRQKRDESGFGIIQVVMKIQQLVQSCKKQNPPPPTNQTNPVIQFVEEHDIQCLMDGLVKIFQEMTPSNKASRNKRDAASILMEFLQLQQDIEKCKIADASPTNTTNIIEKVMHDYDIGCLATTLMNFIKTISQSNSNQRSKRAIEFSDVTCFIMKLMGAQSKIEDVINAFKPKEHARTRRAASTQQICDDFGTTIDTVLKFVMDFAPNQQPSQ